MGDTEDSEPVKDAKQDDRTIKEILEIRELDDSIKKMEQQLKIERMETSDLHLKTRKELEEFLLQQGDNSEVALVKSTRKFLELLKDFEKNEISSSRDRAAKATETAKVPHDDLETLISMSDQEKERIEFLTKDSSMDELETNPFRIPISPRTMNEDKLNNDYLEIQKDS